MQMKGYMMETGNLNNFMAKVLTNTQMEMSMKETGKEVRCMEKGNTNIKMEQFVMDSGDKVRLSHFKALEIKTDILKDKRKDLWMPF